LHLADLLIISLNYISPRDYVKRGTSVDRCPSVRLSRLCIVLKWQKMSNYFLRLV